MFAIVMAKLPEAGSVKTRLAANGRYTARQAAMIARAMLQCTVVRLANRWPVLLGVSPDDAVNAMPGYLPQAILHQVRFTAQGSGDLGRRMARVWEQIPKPQAVTYFGIDSPDVPGSLLDELTAAVAVSDVALGPTDDGGIWTLAAGRPLPELLVEIDWGTEHVYDQLRDRAAALGLSVHTLSRWRDIDRPSDVDAMMQHLEQLAGNELEPALADLLAAVRSINATVRNKQGVPEYAGEDEE